MPIYYSSLSLILSSLICLLALTIPFLSHISCLPISATTSLTQHAIYRDWHAHSTWLMLYEPQSHLLQHVLQSIPIIPVKHAILSSTTLLTSNSTISNPSSPCTYYVNSQIGNDNNNGTTIDTPLYSINKACSLIPSISNISSITICLVTNPNMSMPIYSGSNSCTAPTSIHELVITSFTSDHNNEIHYPAIVTDTFLFHQWKQLTMTNIIFTGHTNTIIHNVTRVVFHNSTIIHVNLRSTKTSTLLQLYNVQQLTFSSMMISRNFFSQLLSINLDQQHTCESFQLINSIIASNSAKLSSNASSWIYAPCTHTILESADFNHNHIPGSLIYIQPLVSQTTHNSSSVMNNTVFAYNTIGLRPLVVINVPSISITSTLFSQNTAAYGLLVLNYDISKLSASVPVTRYLVNNTFDSNLIGPYHALSMIEMKCISCMQQRSIPIETSNHTVIVDQQTFIGNELHQSSLLYLSSFQLNYITGSYFVNNSRQDAFFANNGTNQVGVFIAIHNSNMDVLNMLFVNNNTFSCNHEIRHDDILSYPPIQFNNNYTTWMPLQTDQIDNVVDTKCPVSCPIGYNTSIALQHCRERPYQPAFVEHSAECSFMWTGSRCEQLSNSAIAIIVICVMILIPAVMFFRHYTRKVRVYSHGNPLVSPSDGGDLISPRSRLASSPSNSYSTSSRSQDISDIRIPCFSPSQQRSALHVSIVADDQFRPASTCLSPVEVLGVTIQQLLSPSANQKQVPTPHRHTSTKSI